MQRPYTRPAFDERGVPSPCRTVQTTRVIVTKAEKTQRKARATTKRARQSWHVVKEVEVERRAARPEQNPRPALCGGALLTP